MKPTNIEGRFHGEYSKTALAAKLLENFNKSKSDKDTARKNKSKDRTVKLSQRAQRKSSDLLTTKKKAPRSSNSKSKSKAKPISKSKSRTKDPKSSLKKKKIKPQSTSKKLKKSSEEEETATELALAEITRQIEIHQKQASEDQVRELKSRSETLGAELLKLTREKNNLQLSYDTDRLRWRDEKGRLNSEILKTCSGSGVLEGSTQDLGSALARVKEELETVTEALRKQSEKFDRSNELNVQLEEAMNKVGLPSVEKYDKDHFVLSHTRVTQMIEFESKKSGTLNKKIEDRQNRATELKKRVQALNKEIFEVDQFHISIKEALIFSSRCGNPQAKRNRTQ